ncbi:MAG: alpha/beta fold hydrolase [Candidatus Nanopelagicales bacterium]|nr:alpha/beta fold hydrolase [Candidatus Nanopelagicales bacterium]
MSRTPRLRTSLLGAVVAFGLLGLGVSACSSPTPRTSPSLPPAKVTWAACTDSALAGVECGPMEVPVDWDRPDGPKLTISIARHKATGTTEERIGSLFWNPGGPGVEAVSSSIELWKSMSENMRKRFDLVSMDPRGVGKSQPDLSACDGVILTTKANWPVDWKAMAEVSMDEAAKLNRKCQEKTPNAGFVGTWQVVRDLDALRAAVGDRKLTYLGVSYGSRIGYTYALTFPDRVRALVLNGEVGPDNNKLINPVGPDQAMQVFAKAQPGAWKKFEKTLAHLEKSTLPGGEQPITRARQHRDRTRTQGPGRLPRRVDLDRESDVERMVQEAQQRASLEGGYNALDAYSRCSGFTLERKPIPGNEQVSTDVKALLGNSTFDPQTPYAPAPDITCPGPAAGMTPPK